MITCRGVAGFGTAASAPKKGAAATVPPSAETRSTNSRRLTRIAGDLRSMRSPPRSMNAGRTITTTSERKQAALLARLGVFHEFQRRQGGAGPETLVAVAAADVEEIELRARAYAFGDHAKPKPARKRDDGLGDGCVTRVGFEVGDE